MLMDTNPSGLGGIISQSPYIALQQQIDKLAVRADKLERGMYGDKENEVEGVAENVRFIRAELESLKREVIYWRILQLAIFAVFIYLVLN